MSWWSGAVAAGPGGLAVDGHRTEESAGPWSRVIVVGSRAWTDASSVRVGLTSAWRDAGQPLRVVIGPGRTAVDATVEEWVAEHAVAGHEVQRCNSLFFMEAVDDAGRPRAWRVLAFIQDGSHGASRCLEWARELGLDVRLCEAAS